MFQQDKPLKDFTTLGVGGSAKYFKSVSSVEAMQATLRQCFQEGIPYIILGKGSNVLFDDRGFDGLVILNKINFVKFEGVHVSAGSGYSFALLGSQTARKGLGGLEFALGIPGSVGGAVYMNAGAGGVDTSQHLKTVSFVNEDGSFERLSKGQLDFSYRYSSFQKRAGAIVEAEFELYSNEEAKQKQLDLIQYRLKSQPYGDKSAGCAFRNPSGQSAGRLIEECGLKGLRIGDAEVSSLHANFIINKKNASAKDILQLIEAVEKTVEQKTGVRLEREMVIYGFSS